MENKKVGVGYNLIVDRTGERYITNEGYTITIVAYRKNKDCDIIFENGFLLKNKSMTAIQKGNIKNPFHRGVYGVGYFGAGKYKSRVNKKLTKAHCIWFSMLQRCYDGKNFFKNPTYEFIDVCEDWHNFQNFARWFEENWKDFMDKDWQLDKDMLSGERKIYSPETCCIIPREINNFLSLKTKENLLPTGVHIRKDTGKYTSEFKINKLKTNLGSYITAEEAFVAYKNEKEIRAKILAERYIGKIPEKVYNILSNYKVVPYSKDSPPKIILNNPLMSSEDIDRSFGNSPYYFYNE